MKQQALTSMLGVFIVLATANVTLAQTGPTNFPMVGITGAQTLQLNLVAFPPDPCLTVQLGFQNRNGVAVGPSHTVSLQQGQSVSLAFNLSSFLAPDPRDGTFSHPPGDFDQRRAARKRDSSERTTG